MNWRQVCRFNLSDKQDVLYLENVVLLVVYSCVGRSEKPARLEALGWGLGLCIKENFSPLLVARPNFRVLPFLATF